MSTLIELFNAFDHAAKEHGHHQECGFGTPAIVAKAEYEEAKRKLIVHLIEAHQEIQRLRMGIGVVINCTANRTGGPEQLKALLQACRGAADSMLDRVQQLIKTQQPPSTHEPTSPTTTAGS